MAKGFVTLYDLGPTGTLDSRHLGAVGSLMKAFLYFKTDSILFRKTPFECLQPRPPSHCNLCPTLTEMHKLQQNNRKERC